MRGSPLDPRAQLLHGPRQARQHLHTPLHFFSSLLSKQAYQAMTTESVPAHRLPSLPYPTDELFAILRTDEDLLDFPNLEWVLDNEVELPVQPAAPASLEAPPPTDHLTGLIGVAATPALYAPAPPLITSGWSGPMDMHLPKQDAKVEPSSSGDTHELMLAPLQHSNESLANHAAAAVAAAQARAPVGARNSFTARTSTSHNSTEGEADAPPSKKKRTRNAEQMAQNRVAQQKYRERKKQEHEQLQNALDQLTAQLAALKAMEAQAAVLQSENAVLSATTAHQAERIAELTAKVESQAVELAAAKQEAASAAALVSSQQMMILDQHTKLKLQEEVIQSLRERLSDKMDAVFEGHDPKVVCQRMIQAVRASLAGAKNVEGLQEVLEKLPDDVVTNICKSILCEVKSMWPELAARLHSLKLCTNYRCEQVVAC